jgi:predicted porin
MKKLILAAALASVAGVASAQQSVSIYGAINEYVTSTKTGSTTANGLTSDISNIGFKVSENLGNGVTARAQIETYIQANDTTSSSTYLGDRQSTVGLANKFGSIDLGRNVHSLFVGVASTDPFGALIGSIATDVHTVRSYRISNAVFLTSAPVNGLNVSYEKTMSSSTTSTDPYAAGASYQIGNVTLNASRYDDSVLRTATNLYGGSVKFGNTTALASFSRNTDSGVKRNGQMYGVAQQMGAVTLKASIGKDDAGLNAYNVGASYALSKRTLLDAGYRNVNATGTASDVKQVFAGVRFAF